MIAEHPHLPCGGVDKEKMLFFLLSPRQELVHPIIHPLYDLLEHVKWSDLQIQKLQDLYNTGQ